MKYLYDYECDKEGLSSKDELQQAIDGNRREGRRSSYGHYSEMVGATPPPSSALSGRNNNSLQGLNSSSGNHHTSPLSLVARQVNGHSSQGMSSGDEDNASLSSTPSHHMQSLPAQNEALNLEVKAQAMSQTNGGSRSDRHRDRLERERDRELLESNRSVELATRKLMEEALSGGPPAKRFLSDEERFLLGAGYPTAHIKISSRGKCITCIVLPTLRLVYEADSRSQLDSGVLVVSMDINGMVYQGVLQTTPSNHRSRHSWSWWHEQSKTLPYNQCFQWNNAIQPINQLSVRPSFKSKLSLQRQQQQQYRQQMPFWSLTFYAEFITAS